MESFYINFYIEDKKVKGVDFNTCIEFLLYYIYKKATFLVVRWLREHRGPRRGKSEERNVGGEERGTEEEKEGPGWLSVPCYCSVLGSCSL